MRTLLLSLLVGGTVLAVPPATFTGIITDTECTQGGHSRMRMGETDAECARACAVYHGSAYVLEEGKDVYALSDQKLAELFAARKVTVVGTLDVTGKTIQVESIAAVKTQ